MKALRANDEGSSSSSGYMKDSCNNTMGTVKIQSRVFLLCNEKGMRMCYLGNSDFLRSWLKHF